MRPIAVKEYELHAAMSQRALIRACMRPRHAFGYFESGGFTGNPQLGTANSVDK
jgi:hypothetical protein